MQLRRHSHSRRQEISSGRQTVHNSLAGDKMVGIQQGCLQVFRLKLGIVFEDFSLRCTLGDEFEDHSD